MIVASLLLVIAAAVTLLIGLFNRPDIQWVYASIACCLLAGLLLTIGVLRSRPSRKPVLQSGGQGQASWAGASTWGGAAGEGNDGGATVLTRDDEDEQAQTAALQGDDEPTYTSMPAAPAEAPEASPWAPEDDDDTGDVRVVPPPADEVPAAPAAPAPVEAAAEDEDVVVVPKPSSRNGAPAASAAPSPAAAAAPAPAGKDTSEDAARFEQVLKPIAGVGPAKRQAIYQHFGTYRKLRAASVDKLVEVPGVSRALAERIHQALHSK